MSDEPADRGAWWARGLLFENCNCQAVCPGHVHFDQLCTHDECVGYWAMVFQEGDFGGTSLAGARSVIAYRSPQHMIEGNWTQVILIDEDTTPEQRQAIEAILTGAAGGPWAVLGRFVSTRLETRIVPITVEDRGRTKRVVVAAAVGGEVAGAAVVPANRERCLQHRLGRAQPDG